jgi:hypothetical protein
MKEEPNSVDWVVALYFAEVFGRKYYFCCRLDPNENGIDPCIIEMSVNMLQYSYHLYDMLLLPGECYACKGKVWKICSTLSQVDLKVACLMFPLVRGTNE